MAEGRDHVTTQNQVYPGMADLTKNYYTGSKTYEPGPVVWDCSCSSSDVSWSCSRRLGPEDTEVGRDVAGTLPLAPRRRPQFLSACTSSMRAGVSSGHGDWLLSVQETKAEAAMPFVT